MSYLIRNGEVIAKTCECLASGEEVEYAYDTSEEKLNAAIDVCLVNARYATISNNTKKWDKITQHQFLDVAQEVNKFHTSSGCTKQFVIREDEYYYDSFGELHANYAVWSKEKREAHGVVDNTAYLDECRIKSQRECMRRGNSVAQEYANKNNNQINKKENLR